MLTYAFKQYYNWSVAFLFGYGIPWWAWAVIGMAAAIAVFVLLPALVPERLRMAAAGLVFTLGAIVSAGSWGINRGIHTERASWEHRVVQERKRLQEETTKQLAAETERATAAEASASQLRGQLNALLSATPVAPIPAAPAANPDGVVIDESFIDGLHNLGKPAPRASKWRAFGK